MTEEQTTTITTSAHTAPASFYNADLHKHMSCFGDAKQAHEEAYRRTHGRIEHGYGEE